MDAFDDNDAEEAEEEQEEEEELDPNNPDHLYIIIERSINQMLGEIEANPEMSQYAEEINRAYEFLYRTYTSEKNLEKKVEEMTEELTATNEKLEVALHITEADTTTIADLTEELEKTWKLADNAHLREQMAQEIIDNLRKEIAALNAELDFKNKMGGEEDEAAAETAKTQESLIRDKERLLTEIDKMTQKLTNALAYQEDLERRASTQDLQIESLTTELNSRDETIKKKTENEEILKAQSNEQAKVIEEKDREIQDFIRKVEKANKQRDVSDNLLRETRLRTDKLMRENETLNAKHEKLQDDYNAVLEVTAEMKNATQKKNLELKLKEDECRFLRKDLGKMTKLKEFGDRKLIKMEQGRAEMIEGRNQLRQVIADMEKDVEKYKKQSDADKRIIEEQGREKDVLSKNLLRLQAASRDHIKLIKIQQQIRKKIEKEMDDYIKEIGKQAKEKTALEKERDRLVEESIELSRKIEETMDEVKIKKAEIFGLKKMITEVEAKLKMQQNLFDAIRAERNQFQKALQESMAEAGELKGKLKISIHQTEQLKEDASMKEHDVIKIENVLKKLLKEKENLKIEINNHLDKIKDLKGEITEMSEEEKRLHKVIMENERTIKQQVKDLENLMKERDILGSQLVRRNDELALLYEKIKILQTTLYRGEAQYEQRVDDIRLLKVEIKRLRQEKKLLSVSVSNISDLRKEVINLEKDLTKERLKVRALEQEIQTPLNIHRWRKLEGSDPDALELIQKVQILQKRVINITSESIERERHLTEIESLYTTLKRMVEKQPGPEIQTELVKTQKALVSRSNKMKCLLSELNMTEQNALQYKQEMEKLKDEIKELRKKYLWEKKSRRKLCEFLATIDKPSQDTNHKQGGRNQTNQTKFAGGGFRMSIDGVTK
ncbi:cilia- and flagella-associated protein 58-like [Agrilus planipennis]|uniref:Cilia- and flagella-associated protein 58-like n=1 Tax=Agrilus planipennis TaxID=224129 RepID=A0A1W4WG87_AGRPL|nr:cilia- and flagella-associated protein 58-like [Agrilus planipennis]